MRFDLFYELASPPALARSDAQLYADALDEIALAERLGFGAAWLVEHHFMRGYSHSAKPEIILGAAAARTRTLRLGLAVIPLPYHHPVHVAERIATLDALSNGRLEVGIGRGFSPQEYAVFGARMADSRALVDEGLRVLRAAARPGAVNFGEHQLDIVPGVVQRPHPPLWTAAVSPETFDWAAHEGLGVLAGPFKPWSMVVEDIKRYRTAWRHDAPRRIGMTVGMLCLEDGQRARALAAPALRWSYGELLRVVRPVLEGLFPSYERFGELGRYRRLLRFGAHPRLLDLAGLTVVGNPQECIARIARYRDAGVTHLLCAIGAGGLPTEIVRESMAVIAARVMPHFAGH